MNKGKRFQVILDELDKHKSVQVKQLSEKFNVSMETIRRDLEELEEQHYLKRVYGGAVPLKKNTQAQHFIERKHIHMKEKQMLAKKCVPLVNEGDLIAFDASTTNAMIAQEFMDHFKQLTVLTNDLLNAQQIAQNTSWTILIPGGEMNNQELSVEGASAIEYIHRFRIDKYFMSISGFTPDIGFMDYGYKEHEIKMAMFRNSDQIYVAADHHKFGQHASIKICKPDKVTGTITNEGIDPEIVRYFRDNKFPLNY